MNARTIAVAWFVALGALSALTARAAEPKIDVQAHPDAQAYVRVQVDAFTAHPDLKPLIDIFQKMRAEASNGISPLAMTETHLSLLLLDEKDEYPIRSMPVVPFIVFRFVNAEEAERAFAELKLLEPAEHAGKKYFHPTARHLYAAYRPDPQTLIRGTEFCLKRYLENPQPPAVLVAAVQRESLHGPVRGVVLAGFVEKILKGMPDEVRRVLPPAIYELTKLPKHVTAVAGCVDLQEECLRIEFDLKGGEPLAPTKEALDGFVQFGRDMFKLVALPQIEKSPAPAEVKDLAKSLAAETLDKLKVTGAKKHVEVTLEASPALPPLARSTVKVVANALSQARQQAEQFRVEAELRMVYQCFAMYELRHHGELPDDTRDANGKALLSWRAALIVDEIVAPEDETKKFDAKLAWDAPANRDAGLKIPGFYALKPKPAEGIPPTTLFRLTGPGTLFDGRKKMQLDDVQDKRGETILLVHATPAKPIPWTQPADLVFDPKDPLAALGKIAPTGILVLMADGSTRRLPATIKPATFKALVTPNGGETIDPQELEMPNAN